MKNPWVIILVFIILISQLSKVSLFREIVLRAGKNPQTIEAVIETYQKFPYYETYYSDLVVLGSEGEELYRQTVLEGRDSSEDTKVEFKVFKWDGRALILQGRERYVGPTRLEF